MRIGILQPGYLPWLGFFEQMDRCDLFVLYDDVQYDKNGWRNRNRIKTPNGVQWLTVPVSVRFSESPRIHEVSIDNAQNWSKKHVASLRQSYSRAAHFADAIGMFEQAYAREWERLADLDVHLVLALAGALGIRTPTVRSSSLGVEGDRLERLVGICRRFGADTFYEGASGRSYIDARYFLERGIRVEYQDYRHPTYPQLHGEFVPNLSIVDLLFNCGQRSLEILRNEAEEGPR